MPRQRRFFAPCTHGLEPVLEQELQRLGAHQVESRRGGVHFRGELPLGYAACLWLRTAIRVQEELAHGTAHSREDLYSFVRRVNWSEYLRVDQTLAVDAAIRDSFANDPRTPALVVKDAIVDQFRDQQGVRPSVERNTPNLPLRVVLQGSKVRLYRDYSTESLHKRGYRPIQVKSPLNECLAAGLLVLAGWSRQWSLLDPMCGSGTFLIEAAWMASDRAPGLGRSFPFDLWPDFDAAAWNRLAEDAARRAREGLARIPRLLGADRHEGALELAKKAAGAAGVADHIEFRLSRVSDLDPGERPDTVVTNPPYGLRIGRGEDLTDTWHDLGTFLHEKCPGSRAFVLSGNQELTRLLRLKATRKWPVKNGPIDARWIRYDLRSAVD